MVMILLVHLNLNFDINLVLKKILIISDMHHRITYMYINF